MAAKVALESCTLSHPRPDAHLELCTNSSDLSISASLEQWDGGWHPLGFTSHSLTKAEARYSMFNQELLVA